MTEFNYSVDTLSYIFQSSLISAYLIYSIAYSPTLSRRVLQKRLFISTTNYSSIIVNSDIFIFTEPIFDNVRTKHLCVLLTIIYRVSQVLLLNINIRFPSNDIESRVILLSNVIVTTACMYVQVNYNTFTLQ